MPPQSHYYKWETLWEEQVGVSELGAYQLENMSDAMDAAKDYRYI